MLRHPLRAVLAAVCFFVFSACQGTGHTNQNAVADSMPKHLEEYHMDHNTGNSASDIIASGADADFLTGRFDPSGHPMFVPVQRNFASREGMYMHREAYDAFVRMHAAARQDGVRLVIISAARNFDHQKRIWENKWHGRQILYGGIRATDLEDPLERALELMRFSAMPGTSRHHWGTDVDLNSLDNSYFDSGEGLRIYQWLMANAHEFGFCQPYTRHGNGRSGGYEEEKWHWSYMPLSSTFLNDYKALIDYSLISDFDGSETARKLKVLERFVFDINTGCLAR